MLTSTRPTRWRSCTDYSRIPSGPRGRCGATARRGASRTPTCCESASSYSQFSAARHTRSPRTLQFPHVHDDQEVLGGRLLQPLRRRVEQLVGGDRAQLGCSGRLARLDTGVKRFFVVFFFRFGLLCFFCDIFANTEDEEARRSLRYAGRWHLHHGRRTGRNSSAGASKK